ncbi:MAG: TolC family protein [Gemmatimonadaceae bacterium]
MFRKLILVLLAAPVVLGAQQMTDNSPRPVSLAEAVKLAKENNVSAITAANSVRSAQLTIRSNKAQLYPSLSLSAGQNKSIGDRIGPGQTLIPAASNWAYSTGISLQQTLFDGGKAFADTRTARANVVAAQANEIASDFGIVFNVKSQYNNILAAQESDAAARAQLLVAQQQLDISIAKVNAGAANVADSLNSVVLVGTAQIAILTAQQSLKAASAALTHLVGTPYMVTANPADTVEIAGAPLDSVTLTSLALNGPTIRAFQAQLNAANATERSSRTGYLPTITASASYSGSGASSIYGLNSNPYPYSKTLGVNASYQVFNRYVRENNVVNAQISAENALAQIKDQKLTAQQTIITELGVIRIDEAKIKYQLVSIEAVQEALRVDEQRYQLGAGLLVNVLTDQQNLILARQTLISTRLDLRNARAAIEQFIGRDLP